MSTPGPPLDSLDLGPTPPEVKHYNHVKFVLALYSLAVNFVFLAALAFLFGPDVDRFVRGLTGDERWYRLIGLAIFYGVAFELLTLPIDFYAGHVVEHRFHLSNLTLGGWIVRRLKGYLVGGVLGLVMLLGLYSFIWFSGSWWWLWAALGWLGFSLLMGRIAPVLIQPFFDRITRLDDDELCARLEKLAIGTGLRIEGVYRLHMSDETKKVNAQLSGLGKSRRVLLGDTLLDQFTPEEIEVVFAHELGHHVHRHLPKLVAAGVATSLLAFWLIDLLERGAAPALGYRSFDDPAALPLLLFVPMCVGLVLMPLGNALSRVFERQCDRYALTRTTAPRAFRSAFVKLARINKADPDPHPLKVWLFHSHPPIRERLAQAVDGNPHP